MLKRLKEDVINILLIRVYAQNKSNFKEKKKKLL